MYGKGTRIAVYMDINTADYKRLKSNTIEDKEVFISRPSYSFFLLTSQGSRKASTRHTAIVEITQPYEMGQIFIAR